jgi:hypothetical protein
VKHVAGSLLDYLMDMKNAPEPRMPWVEGLKLLDLMGVISSLCTTQLSHTTANLPGRPVDMWTIGGADRLRSPTSRANSESREMLAFRPPTHRHDSQQND